MAVSQNGWPANNSSVIASYTIPGTDVRIALRKGDASVVLLHFAAWFHRTIQPLRQPDTGGYNPRPIRGSTATSNHASGTAEDLRWNDHPLGAVGTFTAKQASAIRAQLKYYEGVIRWGGDYSGRKDEMHVEINKGTAATKAVADKIREENSMPSADDYANAVIKKIDDAPIGGKARHLGNSVDWLVDNGYATKGALDDVEQKIDTLTKAVQTLTAKVTELAAAQ